ncbi:hypothetical protein K5549_002733 [Capra hircus]|nr:hypothetical protein K5549_002733 [Capra hircus]
MFTFSLSLSTLPGLPALCFTRLHCSSVIPYLPLVNSSSMWPPQKLQIRHKGYILHRHYMGNLEDGMEFDSTLPQNQPFVFSLGTGQLIKGEKQKLVIPSELGHGARGAPPKIPSGATLLLKIQRCSEL